MADTSWWGQWEAPKVWIGVPSTGTWTEPFARAMINLVSFLEKDGVEYNVHSVCGSLLPKSRNICAQGAVKNDFTHLLFVDSDQTFPMTVANQLFSHRLPIVAANIATKAIPPQRTACIRPKVGKAHKDARPAMRDTGLEKVWRVGCGVMLIETEVFRRISKPWFMIEWDEANGEVGEDWYFLQKAEDAGIPVYVDHDVSAKVTHFGGFHYKLPEYHV